MNGWARSRSLPSYCAMCILTVVAMLALHKVDFIAPNFRTGQLNRMPLVEILAAIPILSWMAIMLRSRFYCDLVSLRAKRTAILDYVSGSSLPLVCSAALYGTGVTELQIGARNLLTFVFLGFVAMSFLPVSMAFLAPVAYIVICATGGFSFSTVPEPWAFVADPEISPDAVVAIPVLGVVSAAVFITRRSLGHPTHSEHSD